MNQTTKKILTITTPLLILLGIVQHYIDITPLKKITQALILITLMLLVKLITKSYENNLRLNFRNTRTQFIDITLHFPSETLIVTVPSTQPNLIVPCNLAGIQRNVHINQNQRIAYIPEIKVPVPSHNGGHMHVTYLKETTSF